MSSSKFRLLFFILYIFAAQSFSQINVGALLYDAQTELTRNNYFEAIKKLNICISINPSEYKAYFLRGVCKYYLNDNLGAKQDLHLSISIYNPMVYEAYHYLALVKYRLEDYEGAIRDLDKVISKQSDDPQLFVERAFAKLGRMDFKGAISDCDKTLSMTFGTESIYLCKGSAETGLNDFENALSDYGKALKINPKSVDVYVRQGITRARMGKYKEAIVDYNQALKFDSTFTYAYYNRAAANIELNNRKEAMSDYDIILKYEPLNAVVYFDKAILESNMQEFKSAIIDFDKVLMLNPENIQALFDRAKVKQAVKDNKGALSDYNKVIELFPYFVEAYYNRSIVKKSLNDPVGAKKDFDLSNIIADMDRNKDSPQRARDSVNLIHLMALDANFNADDTKAGANLNIDLMPIFYIAIKDSSTKSSIYYDPSLLKINNAKHTYCLANTELYAPNAISDNSLEIINDTEKDNNKPLAERLQKAIGKTNLQLFNDAVKDYDKIIELNPQCAIAYFARGVNTCKELELISRFTIDNDQSTSISNAKFKIKNQKDEKYEKALSDFSKAVQLEPSFALAYYNRAYIKCKQGDFNSALKEYENVIRINPAIADAYYNMGLLLLYFRDKLNACENFSKASELGLTGSYAIIKKYCNRIK